MFYGGSVSPPREPAKKKYIVPFKPKEDKEKMGGGSAESSTASSTVKESSLV